eukprot:72760-Pleurochrysis_carterae.AAC.1
MEARPHKGDRSVHPRISVHGADERLERVFVHGVAREDALGVGWRYADIPVQPHLATDAREHSAVDERRAQAGEKALVAECEALVQNIGDGHMQDRVAREFEALLRVAERCVHAMMRRRLAIQPHVRHR